MEKNILNLKEFELSDFQKSTIRGGDGEFVSGYGNNGQTMSADCLTGNQQDTDAGGNKDHFLHNPSSLPFVGNGNIQQQPSPLIISVPPKRF